MQNSNNATVLAESLDAQTVLYDQAIQIAQRLESTSASAVELGDLQSVLDRIAAFGTSADDIKALREGDQVAVRHQASVLQEKIELLLGLIRTAEDQFRSAKTRLLPQVKQEVTARRMLDAYGGQR